MPESHRSRPGTLCAQGLTLIELLLVMLMLAIAVQMALPGFGARIDDLRSAAAMRHLASLFAFAREEALREGRPVTVCAIDAQGDCSRSWNARHEIQVFVDANANRRPDPGEERLRTVSWPMDGGELSWRASLARPYLEFDVSGGTWQNGTLYYCPASRDARFSRALVVSQSGRSYLTVDSDGDGIREDRRGHNLDCQP